MLDGVQGREIAHGGMASQHETGIQRESGVSQRKSNREVSEKSGRVRERERERARERERGE